MALRIFTQQFNQFIRNKFSLSNFHESQQFEKIGDELGIRKTENNNYNHKTFLQAQIESEIDQNYPTKFRK